LLDVSGSLTNGHSQLPQLLQHSGCRKPDATLLMPALSGSHNCLVSIAAYTTATLHCWMCCITLAGSAPSPPPPCASAVSPHPVLGQHSCLHDCHTTSQNMLHQPCLGILLTPFPPPPPRGRSPSPASSC
jgi:hypothetical protein